ncbi:TetR family transcriptional regulator [Microbispora rosea subsp. aerata]|nr:TetR/AcrR family transcriptional regulator [Microbispora rosea]GGO11422.1 TetR family transcriptional regulator [Microbispora rosea subsp. aerata]GIH55776.1 TetR family transcriptional regulator [Microbispora rosea subsp. aerata]GLJ85926.1 TetR family transcriptional regulator [Microbispora rosea subsp. aerata]
MAPRKKDEILNAALRLLAEKGYEGLTIEGVAERSGVNKTTVYRWWPSKAALLGTALVEARVLDFDAPDTGSLRGDLHALLRGLAGLLTTPPAADIAVAALGAAANNPELAEAARGFFADRFARELPIFERARERGEIDDSADAMTIMDLLAGAVWIRVVFRQLPLDDGFTERAVNAVLDGVGRPGGPEAGRPARTGG